MSLDHFLILLMLAAAAMHAAWNLFVKSDDDKLSALTALMAGGAILAACGLPFVPLPAPASWPFILGSVMAHLGYYVFLLLAYRDGDLSLTYPIARGAAPMLVAFAAMWFAGEGLAFWQWVGIAAISAGIISLAFERGNPFGHHGKPVLYALTTAFFVTSYSLIDGMGVRRAEGPLSYILWLFALEAIPLPLYCAFRHRAPLIAYVRSRWRIAIAGALLSSGAYGMAIWAMSLATIAGIVSLRETSVLFGAAFAAIFLGERFGWRRIGAAIAVVAGNLLLHLV